MVRLKKVVTWTREENEVFVEALRRYPKGILNRFTLISSKFPRKTVDEVICHYVLHIHDMDAIESGKLEILPYCHSTYYDNLGSADQDLILLDTQQEEHGEDVDVIETHTPEILPDHYGIRDGKCNGSGSSPSCQDLTFVNSQLEEHENDAIETGAVEIRQDLPENNGSGKDKGGGASLSCQDLALLNPREEKSKERKKGHKEREGKKSKQRKEVTRWTEDEHRAFLEGITKYGWGSWMIISRWLLPTKTASQLASHAQKFKLRESTSKKRKSIHDITNN